MVQLSPSPSQSPEMKHRILLAEDDHNLGTLIVDLLTSEGYDVILCSNGQIALDHFGKEKFDMCLLDVMMPEKDGFSLAHEIRRYNKKIPILFLTAKSLKEDKLKGYDVGADDFISKPFDEDELILKIKVFIRRASDNSAGMQTEKLTIGKYIFDRKNQSLTFEEITKRMTEKESEILWYLANHPNILIKREEMLKQLWGENDYFLGRSLDVFITKIRKYLKDDPTITIENVFGVGFIFNSPTN